MKLGHVIVKTKSGVADLYKGSWRNCLISASRYRKARPKDPLILFIEDTDLGGLITHVSLWKAAS